jgi:GNAT superfamily N-acetyltransferase
LADVSTRLANGGDLDAVAALFDGYRQFYGKRSDLDGAKTFIGARMGAGDSTIIIAEQDGEAAGFTQLYPSFTSVGMAPIVILNDLFVVSEHRGSGAAQALLTAATDHARKIGAVRLALSTQKDNVTARRLYEKAGWALDEEYCTYNLRLAS